jgi:signal transduction histidine kinase
MVVIPLALCVISVAVISMIASGFIEPGPGNDRPLMDGITYAMESVDGFVEKYKREGSIDALKARMDSFGDRGSIGLSMGIYPLDAIEITPATREIVNMDDGSFVVKGETAAYIREAGDYRIIVSDPNYRGMGHIWRYRSYFISAGIIGLAAFISIILLTNLILTRRMYKSITVPMKVLTAGVYEISDGNLDYRINYGGEDEFAEICGDFDEMAAKLQAMVNARLQDSENRKELVAGISHDLRTPLTSIKAYIEGIETGVAKTPEARKRYIDTIKQKTADIEHIVSQLFLFSKLDMGEYPFDLERVDIGEEIAGFVSGTAEEYGLRGVEIVLGENTRGTEVMADIVQLRNVFINILENSVKHSRVKAVLMRISARAAGEKVEITLTDNGKGAPPESVARLFDVFYRADTSRNNPSKGSGVGLAITSKIIEGFGGEIRAENVKEGGLSVIIALPAIDFPAKPKVL